MTTLTLPREFQAAAEALAAEPERFPHFFRQLRRGGEFDPRLPLLLLHLAERIGVELSGSDQVALLMPGFAGARQPLRLLRAFRVIAGPAWRKRRGDDDGYIYKGNRGLLSFGDGELPRRPSFDLRPTYYPSVLDWGAPAAPPVETPSSEAPSSSSAPAGPSPPPARPARPTILTR